MLRVVVEHLIQLRRLHGLLLWLLLDAAVLLIHDLEDGGIGRIILPQAAGHAILFARLRTTFPHSEQRKDEAPTIIVSQAKRSGLII